MLQQAQRVTGIGPVEIDSNWVYAYWENLYDEGDDGHRLDPRWTVRLSLDEFDSLGLQPYQRVRIRFPNGAAEDVYFRGRRDYPPFTVLSFARSLDA